HRVALRVHVLGILALGVAGAGQERSAPPLADHHRLAALLALVLRGHRRHYRLAVRADVHGRLAVRRAAARQVLPESAALQEHRLATGGAFVLGFHRRRPARVALARLDVVAGLLLVAPAGAAGELAAGLLAVLLDQRPAALRTRFARLDALLLG